MKKCQNIFIKKQDINFSPKTFLYILLPNLRQLDKITKTIKELNMITNSKQIKE